MYKIEKISDNGDIIFKAFNCENLKSMKKVARHVQQISAICKVVGYLL
ncbi:MAG: hypothetical protein ACTSWR_05875 [Candidatus Helarchaeota archaeon]